MLDKSTAFMLSRCDVVHSHPVVVVAFKCVAMNELDLSVFVDGDSSSTFTTLPALVLGIHSPLAEVALIDVEVCRVEREQSW